MLQRAETEAGTGAGVPGAARPAWRGRLDPRPLWARLTVTDRAALGYWLLAHIALLVLAYAAAWTESPGNPHEPLTGQYEHWDAVLLRSIAQYGYWGGPGGKMAHPHQEAFFPGYPLLLALVHLAVRNWVLSELLLSLAAGCVVVVALARLAGDRRAALYLLAAPASVFLMVGYSECLFLAFALPAWLAARSGRWTACGALAFAAALTRPNGLFLIPALVLLALLKPQGPRWRALLGLAVAPAAPLLYAEYLWLHTRRWSAWLDANRAGWGVHFSSPWRTLKVSYSMAFGHGGPADYGLMGQLEIASIGVMLAAVAVLLARRAWPEALYAGFTTVSLASAGYYQACTRDLLLCFPVFVLLARGAARWRWVGGVYLVVGGPLAAVVAVSFFAGKWAG